MVRSHKKMSLYEVIRRAQVRPNDVDDISSQSKTPNAGEDKPVAVPSASWPKKPRLVQCNGGRIEFSLPYQIAVAGFLGVVLLVVIGYRLGMASKQPAETVASQAAETVQDQTESVASQPAMIDSYEEAASADSGAVPQVFRGNNSIVITQYMARPDLVPVQQFFAQNGIETEIVRIDDVYFLRTVDKYENPGRFGTNGYYARQKIIECGAAYKAPDGYESFGSVPFQDVYGKIFNE